MRHITACELALWLNDPDRQRPVLLDVRQPWEVEQCYIPGSHCLSMACLPERFHEIALMRTVVCICHHGQRSLLAAQFLMAQGFTHVMNLTGGIDAWACEVDLRMQRY